MDNRDKRWVRKAIDDRLSELGLLTDIEPEDEEEDESGLEPEDDQDSDDDETETGNALHNQIAEQFQQAMNL